MQRLFILFILQAIFFLPSDSQSIRVSVFNSKDINSFTINIESGKYILKRKSESFGEYKKGSIFHVSRFGNTLELRDKRNFVGNFQNFELSCTTDDGILIINPVNPDLESREYDGNLLVTCENNRIRIINRLDMEKYIAAVIVAEGGNAAPKEYYKAQAVLIRTFTIKNLYKHAEEGFDLCDEVHCQAYKGRCSQHPDILEATISTTGKVLVDKDNILIVSPFHSNCGGSTIPASMVWQKDLPYLQAVEDPFCSTGRNATWTASITRESWLKFLKSYTKNTIDYSRYNFSFDKPARAKFISIHGIDLNMRDIREAFNLRSAYFNIEDDGASIIFHGYGYGHGNVPGGSHGNGPGGLLMV
jgi:stage II sporulation protein D